MSLDLVVEYIYNNCITLKSDSFLKGITFEPRSDFFFEKESLFGQKVIIFETKSLLGYKVIPLKRNHFKSDSLKRITFGPKLYSFPNNSQRNTSEALYGLKNFVEIQGKNY